MVSCKHCAAQNTLDSAYCRKCGTGLPDVEVLEAVQRLDALVETGNRALADGKVDEALAIADAAVSNHPTHAGALALKGDSLAAQGNTALAIECYEQVMSLRPDSTLDRIRLNQLRSTLMVQVVQPEPSRKLAWVAAISIFVLALCMGALAMRMQQSSPAVATLQPEGPAQENGSSVERFEAISQVSPAPNQAGQPLQNPGQQIQEPPRNEPATVTEANGRSAEVAPRRRPNRVGRISGLPEAPEMNSFGPPNIDAEVRPFNPMPQGNLFAPVPATSGQSSVDEDPSLAGRQRPQEPAQQNTQRTAEEDPGTVEITLSNPRVAVTPGGSAPVRNTAEGARALMATATQQFEGGNFSAAVGTFERALQAGGDPVRINQRMGQAFERLGRTGEAIAAYSRAINAAELALANNRGNRASTQAALESSRRSMRALQGN